MKPFRIFINYPDDSGCTYYRSILPYYYCKEDLLDYGIELVMSREVDDGSGYDAYMFHRIANPAFLLRLTYGIAKNKKVIWDLDDNVFCIPEWSPAHKLMNGAIHDIVEHCLGLARWQTVSTERLGQQLNERLGINPVVLPNLINLLDFNSNASRGEPPCQDNGGPFRILWAGSDTHAGDIKQLTEPVKRMIEKHEKNVMFIFVGMLPEGIATGNSVMYIPGLPLDSYQNLMSVLRPHVGLLPLADHEFNVGKSNIKYLEMAVSGATILASPVGPYKDTIRHGIDGILCEDEWFENMDYFYEERDQCRQYARSALSTVKRRYAWSTLEEKWKWMNFFLSVRDA